MVGHETADWAQAIIGGIAILASGLIAVFVPWNDRRLARKREMRARLDVDTRISDSGGLELLFNYKPEFHHQALSVGVALLEPRDARLYGGELQWPSTVHERPMGMKGSLATDVRYNSVALVPPPGSNLENNFQGFMFIEYPDDRKGPTRATIEIEVFVHGNHLIAREVLAVSPVDAGFHRHGARYVQVDKR